MKTYLAILLTFCFITTTVMGIQDYCNKGFKPQQDGQYELDLSPMDRDFMMEIATNTKPSQKITRTYVNICNPLKKPPMTYDEDFCDPNTYVCLRLFHKKGDTERLDEVEELAGDYKNSKLQPEFKVVSEGQDLSTDGTQFSLTLHGGNVLGKAQTVEITLECGLPETRENPNGPNLISDDGYITKLHWKVPFACATKVGEKPPSNGDGGNNGGNNGDQPQEGGKSAIGWFFTMLGIALGVYFIGGAIYNYKVFNARGLDLIPHRDFWLDLPYLIKDLISHLMESVTSRRHGSGGYVSV
ncbi:autophagy-related protein 27 [Halteromyces radiatus]|uniref:autophagy-related protein 27 n=1 Tax=Halteromyces radiatus TaxID=101107 RepID=UPI00221EEA92|nr:autophagy-related protein 27 [Halteromyces radiatus]KAI8093531.1 autophagy-related protein 27 [Halteromyces radiatus]